MEPPHASCVYWDSVARPCPGRDDYHAFRCATRFFGVELVVDPGRQPFDTETGEGDGVQADEISEHDVAVRSVTIHLVELEDGEPDPTERERELRLAGDVMAG